MRNQKLLNLMFNKAASDGEILNCVNALRGAFEKGTLFTGQGSTDSKDKERIARIKHLENLLSLCDKSRIKHIQLYNDAIKKVESLEYELLEKSDLETKLENMEKCITQGSWKLKECQIELKSKVANHLSEKIAVGFISILVGFIISFSIFSAANKNPDEEIRRLRSDIKLKTELMRFQQREIDDLRKFVKRIKDGR